MINRRDFLSVTAGASAALALPPQLLRVLQQQQQGKLMQRAIPSSGEMLPVIGFAPRPTAPPGPGEIKPMPTDVPVAKEVLKTFIERGGKVVDVLHGGPIGEQAGRTAAKELGIENKLFWTTPLSVSVPVLPGYAGPPLKVSAADIRAAMEEKFAKFKVNKIDLVMVGTGADPIHFTVLREMKKEGRIRYIGAHDLLFPPNVPVPYPPTSKLEAIMRNEQIDFIATDYSVGDRRVEEMILPLALERKIAFIAYFPFDRGRIFKRIGTTPLPGWAAEFDAKTWAQFCLKYVLGHPAVTVAREGTTNAEHMLDNIGGGIGRLPTEAMRKRMAEFVDALPPTPAPAPPQGRGGPPPEAAPQAPAVVVSAAILDRYVGEYKYAVASQLVNIRRDGDKLRLKVQGSMPEGALVTRSETTFALPWPDSTIEFKVDGNGKVTGAIVDQFGGQRLALEPQAGIVLPPAVLDSYASQWKTAGGTSVTIRRDGQKLLLTVGANPEIPLIVRSTTRLQDPRGPVFEFQVDGSGNVTGLILEQGNPAQRVPLTRVP